VEKSDEQSVDRPGRGSDKFPLRFPDGLRDRIKAAAAENGRTMNAEIIDRLERADNMDLAMQIIGDGNAERERFKAELRAAEQDREAETKYWSALNQSYIAQIEKDAETIERLESELRAAAQRSEEERQAAQRRGEILDAMWQMLQKMDGLYKQNHDELDEVVEIEKYLQSDHFAMQFELFPDPDAPEGFEPSASAPPPLQTWIGKQLAEHIDLRMLRMVRLTNGMDWPTAKAKVMAHYIRMSDEERSIARQYLEENPGADGGGFYDFVVSQLADVPEDRRAVWEGAILKMMPLLFKGWKNEGASYERS